MQPDGTNSLSTADENPVSPKGIHVTEPDTPTGSEIKKYPKVSVPTWSYLFLHNSKVKSVEHQLQVDNMPYFVHKTIRYYKKKDKHGVQHRETPTVSGLIFLQGDPKALQTYLTEHFISIHLCKNCSTGKVAQIPDAQMRPFMRINATEPERIRFLLKPFHYYARNRILLRITTGELAGLEGYIIRIDRDRRLVMDVGGMSVAISGVHAQHFEEVAPAAPTADASPFYQRNLHEREALLDRYFHPVTTPEDVAAQADNILYLLRYVQDEQSHDRMQRPQAWSTLTFIIKEIAYYYAPLFDQHSVPLAPITDSGTKVIDELHRLIAATPQEEERNRYATLLQELLSHHGYLFQ